MALYTTASREKTVTLRINQIGIGASVLAAIILLIVLGENTLLLLLHIPLADWLLTFIWVGPSIATILGALSSGATFYGYWLLFRRKQSFNLRQQAKDVAIDQALNIPSELQNAPAQLAQRGGCVRQFIYSVFAASVIVTGATAAHLLGYTSIGVNVVNDGSFEQPDVGASGVLEFNSGQSLQGWIVETGSVDLIGSYWVSATGKQSIDLNGADAGAIYQDISTKNGTTYILSFYLAGNPVCGQSVKQMQVWWDANQLTTLSFDSAGHSTSQMGWKKHTYRVQASGDLTRLRFVSLDSSECGPTLDGISVSAG